MMRPMLCVGLRNGSLRYGTDICPLLSRSGTYLVCTRLVQDVEGQTQVTDRTVIEEYESTYVGALGMARARYEAAVIALHEHLENGGEGSDLIPRRKRKDPNEA